MVTIPKWVVYGTVLPCFTYISGFSQFPCLGLSGEMFPSTIPGFIAGSRGHDDQTSTQTSEKLSEFVSGRQPEKRQLICQKDKQKTCKNKCQDTR